MHRLGAGRLVSLAWIGHGSSLNGKYGCSFVLTNVSDPFKSHYSGSLYGVEWWLPVSLRSVEMSSWEPLFEKPHLKYRVNWHVRVAPPT